jgi:hypothetical protein
MKVKMRSSEEQVAIYRDGAGVLVYAISLAVGCIGFGILFVYTGGGSKSPLAFGGLFIAVGLLLLAALPAWSRRIKRDSGALLLVADALGLSIAPMLGAARVTNRWADVSQIVLANKLVEKRVAERTFGSNQVIVYFRQDSLGEDESLPRSPKGRSISVIDFPKGEVGRVKDELVRFFGNGEVKMFSEVVFDYPKRTEQFEP